MEPSFCPSLARALLGACLVGGWSILGSACDGGEPDEVPVPSGLDADSSSAEFGGAVEAGGGPEADTSGPPGAAPPVEVRLEPARIEALDVRLGEVRKHLVEVHLASGEKLPKLREPLSTCNCLSARLLEQDDESALVEVTIEGSEREDIDGGILLEDEAGNRLAEHIVVLLVTPGMFVMPREVHVTRDDPVANFFVCYGVDARDEPPDIVADDPSPDDPRIQLEDWKPVTVLTEHYRMSGWEYVYRFADETFESSGEVVLRLEVLDPEERMFEIRLVWHAADEEHSASQ